MLSIEPLAIGKRASNHIEEVGRKTTQDQGFEWRLLTRAALLVGVSLAQNYWRCVDGRRIWAEVRGFDFSTSSNSLL